MSLIPGQGPVIVNPGSPLSTEMWDKVQPRRAEFAVRSAGGPTQINLSWDSLLEASAHIDAAAEVFSEIGRELGAVLAGFFPTMGHLHWRVPSFQARFGALLAGVAGVEHLLVQAGQGARGAHGAYREAESTIQSWMTLLLRASEHELVAQHALSTNGDKSYAFDWLMTTGALAGGAGLGLVGMRFPMAATVLSTLAALEKEVGMTPALMNANRQVLDPEPVTEFSHSADGSLGTYLESMTEVSAMGDVAVSAIDDGSGEQTYALYIPGLDIDGLESEQGRSPLSLVDALGNESEHMMTVIDGALTAAGVPEGATVVPIGFSMGGIHALNLANNPSLTKKYNIPSAATIGSPAQNKPVTTDVKLTHFADGRDPVPHVLGEQHQAATQRVSIVYDFQNPESEVTTVAGSAHTLEHNIDAIHRVEKDPEQWLTPDQTSQVRALSQPLNGDVRTVVFSAKWRDQSSPERPGAKHLLTEDARHSADDPKGRTKGPLPARDR